MPKRNEFVDYLVEQMASLGEVNAKSMFGGWGIYHEGRMFSLVAADAFYIKVDDASRPEFEREGLRPFRYERREQGEAVMNYYEPPTAAIDNRELLCLWARKGIEAAARAARAAQKRPPKKRVPKKKAR